MVLFDFVFLIIIPKVHPAANAEHKTKNIIYIINKKS
jgi:hypothetical protein